MYEKGPHHHGVLRRLPERGEYAMLVSRPARAKQGKGVNMRPLRDAVHVTLGYFLDGHAWPGAFAASPQGEGVVEGALALGPLGLLGLLQT